MSTSSPIVQRSTKEMVFSQVLLILPSERSIAILKCRSEVEDGEACSEEKHKSAMGPDTKMTRLQIAS